MFKEMSYKEKFNILQEWLADVMEAIKKDLKNDHLKKDPSFVKKYLPQKNVQKITDQELVEAYTKAINEEEKAEDIAEFIFNRWMIRNTEIYYFFEQELSRISPNFTELKEIPESASMKIMEQAIQNFGAPKAYLFTVINSVVFPKSICEKLQTIAKKETQQQKDKTSQLQSQIAEQNIQFNHDQQIARIVDKYEKKLQGLQKKYQQDMEAYKKQIAALQRQLNGK